mgnify:CR=1 FL=1
MLHYASFKDSKNTRVFTTVINGTEYETVVEISALLPLLVTDDDRMENQFTIIKKETNTNSLQDITFKDPTFDKDSKQPKERFIVTGYSTSAMNNMDIVLLYDRKYKDIIIFTSPVDYKILKVDMGRISFSGLGLGTAMENEYTLLSQRFNTNDKTYPLPETKENVTITSRIVMIPDLAKIDRGSGGINTIEKIEGDYNLQYGSKGHSGIIDLGPVENFFEGEGKIPTYLLKQAGFLTYDFVFAGNKPQTDLTGKRLYIIRALGGKQCMQIKKYL